MPVLSAFSREPYKLSRADGRLMTLFSVSSVGRTIRTVRMRQGRLRMCGEDGRDEAKGLLSEQGASVGQASGVLPELGARPTYVLQLPVAARAWQGALVTHGSGCSAHC